MSSPPVSNQRSDPARAVLSPGLRRLLGFVLLLFGLLAVNSLYLGSITLAEQLSGQSYQN